MKMKKLSVQSKIDELIPLHQDGVVWLVVASEQSSMLIQRKEIKSFLDNSR